MIFESVGMTSWMCKSETLVVKIPNFAATLKYFHIEDVDFYGRPNNVRIVQWNVMMFNMSIPATMPYVFEMNHSIPVWLRDYNILRLGYSD